MRVAGLPRRGAKNSVIAHESGVVLPIGPCVASAVEVDITQCRVQDETAEAVHGPVIDAAIILIGEGSNHVEVATDKPRPCDHVAKIMKLSEEGKLVGLGLRPTDARKPPCIRSGGGGDCRGNVIGADDGVRKSDHVRAPGDQDTTMSAVRGEEEEASKVTA